MLEHIKNYLVQLDFYRGLPYERIKFVQGDTACDIKFEILSNGEIVDLSNKTVTVTIQKQDKSTATYATSITDNIAIWELTPGALSIPGKVEASVEVYQDTKRLTTSRFMYSVLEEIEHTAIIEDDGNYPILITLIADIQALENSISTAESGRVAAETLRVTEYNAMKTEFNTLKVDSEATTTNANNAADNANSKANLADTAANNAGTKANLAQSKADLANESATNADTKATLADTKATLAQAKADLADSKATLANTAANTANTAASNAEAARVRIEGKETTWDNAEAQRVTKFNQIKTDYENATNENTVVELTTARTNEDGTTFDNIGARMNAADAQRSDIVNQSYRELIFNSSFNWLEFCTGGSAEIKSIKGQTKVNLANNGVDYGNWTVGAGSSKSATGIHLVQNDTNESAYMLTDLKPNTIYTLIYKVSSADATDFKTLTGGTALGSSVNLQTSIGIKKVLVQTAEIITNNRLYFVIGGNSANGEYVDFEVYGILEGDETDLEITEPLKYGINSSLIRNIKILGANRFDKSVIGSPVYDVAKIEETTGVTIKGTTVNTVGYYSMPYSLKPNTQYTIKSTITVINGSAKISPRSSNGTSLGSLYATGEVTFTTDNVGTGYLYIYAVNAPSTGDFEVKYEDLQLVEGITAPKEYISYQKPSIETIEKTLHGFNNIHDEIVDNTVKFCNKRKLFNGTEGWELSGTLANVYRFILRGVIPDALGGNLTALSNLLSNVYNFALNEEHFYTVDNGDIIIFFNQSTIDAETGITVLDKLNTYLQANNLDIIYNTKEDYHVVEVLKDYNNKLTAFPDGYMQIDFTGVCPEVSVKYAINIAAVRETMSDMAKSNADQINNIWDAFYLITKEIQALQNK